MKTPNFCSKLHRKLDKETKNSFFSPFSIQVALGMTVVGAKNETKTALCEVLGSPNDNSENQFFSELVDAGMAKNEAYELVTANALWLQQGQAFDETYLENVSKYFRSSATEVNYKQPTTACNVINEWCNENTKTKIPSIINEDFINEDTLLILTNAIYFKGKWSKKFNPAKKGKFTTVDAKEIEVDLMSIKDEDFKYGETDRFQVVDLPYQGDELSMLVILPFAMSTAYIDNNMEQAYQDALQCLRMREDVSVTLPKFKVETSYALGNTLKEMGLALPFSDRADFSGICPVALKISEVLHKAFVECDEEGTTAAAATAVGMMRCMSVKQNPRLVADHPFVFMIKNKENEILFCGRIANPNDKN